MLGSDLTMLSSDPMDVPMSDVSEPAAKPTPRKCSTCPRPVSHMYRTCDACREKRRNYERNQKAQEKREAFTRVLNSPPSTFTKQQQGSLGKGSVKPGSGYSVLPSFKVGRENNESYKSSSAPGTSSISLLNFKAKTARSSLLADQSKISKAKETQKIDQYYKRKVNHTPAAPHEVQSASELYAELKAARAKEAKLKFSAFYCIVDVAHKHHRRIEEVADALRKQGGLSFSAKPHKTRTDTECTFYLSKYRCLCWMQDTPGSSKRDEASAPPPKDCGGTVSIRVAEDKSHYLFSGQKITVSVEHT